MHEWALAESVIEASRKECETNGYQSLKQLSIAIGELQHIDIDVFRFAMEKVFPSQDNLFQDVEMDFHIEKASFHCGCCGHVFGFDDLATPLNPEESETVHMIPELVHSCVSCPQCQSIDFQIVAGRGILVDLVEGE